MESAAQGRVPYLSTYRSSVVFIIVTVAFADVFLYGVIVPVLPFALTYRVAIGEGEVQFWVSILLAVYGAALLISSRKIPLE
ncbi:uncharacterized protein GLRG_01926 [Colletotrichum graminicola M1.001]|uniref:MFS transporter n=1 Tax=Colletotrichum graminicola (strain M1.001 / M2 / FGSC 10212) TaxID=645133 RepID=E3Q8R7_COLGM|nr:uncharacterized protein GLRG_01926 [Colletotrichum graminicola M1.001]EFQ27431.1 hypothetical protein GLRG_01926 [Colletotrichum graminicola M1.001]